MVRVFLHGFPQVALAQQNAHKTWFLLGSAEWQAELVQHSDSTEQTNRSG
jgi:hypothetical protein